MNLRNNNTTTKPVVIITFEITEKSLNPTNQYNDKFNIFIGTCSLFQIYYMGMKLAYDIAW